MRHASHILMTVSLLIAAGTTAHAHAKHAAKATDKSAPHASASEHAATSKKAAPAATARRGHAHATEQVAKETPAHGRRHAHAEAPEVAEAPAHGRGRKALLSHADVRTSYVRDRHGRLRRVSLNPRLNTVALGSSEVSGSHDSLVRQNVKTVEDGLDKIQNDRELHQRIVNNELVQVPVSESLALNPSLPEDRRYCRPWTASFLDDMAKAHAEVFHRALLVSSAVRTVTFQAQLRHHNRNAAPAVGEVTSPHLTGAAVDIAKTPLSNEEREWMRQYLLKLQNEGKIDVEEEFRQQCFHITVYRSYTGDAPIDPANPQQEPQSPAADVATTM